MLDVRSRNQRGQNLQRDRGRSRNKFLFHWPSRSCSRPLRQRPRREGTGPPPLTSQRVSWSCHSLLCVGVGVHSPRAATASVHAWGRGGSCPPAPVAWGRLGAASTAAVSRSFF